MWATEGEAGRSCSCGYGGCVGWQGADRTVDEGRRICSLLCAFAGRAKEYERWEERARRMERDPQVEEQKDGCGLDGGLRSA